MNHTTLVVSIFGLGIIVFIFTLVIKPESERLAVETQEPVVEETIDPVEIVAQDTVVEKVVVPEPVEAPEPVVVDDIPPELNVTSPYEGQEFMSREVDAGTEVTFAGTYEPGAELYIELLGYETVNNRFLEVNSNGVFSGDYIFLEYSHTEDRPMSFIFKATDAAGNETSRLVNVLFVPEEAEE